MKHVLIETCSGDPTHRHRCLPHHELAFRLDLQLKHHKLKVGCICISAKDIFEAKFHPKKVYEYHIKCKLQEFIARNLHLCNVGWMQTARESLVLKKAIIIIDNIPCSKNFEAGVFKHFSKRIRFHNG